MGRVNHVTQKRQSYYRCTVFDNISRGLLHVHTFSVFFFALLFSFLVFAIHAKFSTRKTVVLCYIMYRRADLATRSSYIFRYERSNRSSCWFPATITFETIGGPPLLGNLELENLVYPFAELGDTSVNSRLIRDRATYPPTDHPGQDPSFVACPLDHHRSAAVTLQRYKLRF